MLPVFKSIMIRKSISTVDKEHVIIFSDVGLMCVI